MSFPSLLDDLPASPKVGESLVFRFEPLLAAGAGPEFHGLVVAGDGRLTVAANGSGIGVRMSAADAMALAMVLIGVSGQLAAAEAVATADAEQVLARAKGGGHA